MKRDKKEIIIPWLIIIYTWPFFSAWVTLFQRSWLMLPLMAATGLLFVPEYLRSKIFSRGLLFYVILLIGFLFGCHYYDSIVSVVCAIFLYTAVSSFACYLSKNDRDTSRNTIFWATIIFIVFTTAASYYINLSYPNIIRYSGNGENEDAYRMLVTSLQKFGLSNFDITHALPILVPALILGFKSVSLSTWKRYSFLALALICVFHTYISGSATPFLLSILVLIASLVLHIGSLRSNTTVFVSFVILGIIFLSPSVISMIISFVSSLLGADSGELLMRLSDIDEAVTTGNTDVGDMGLRMNLYQSSLDAFYSNVLFGSRSLPIGGHSFILDTLGAYGLVGFFALLSYVVSQLKNIMKSISPNLVSFYVLSIIAAVVMLVSKNAGTWATWCFLFIVSPVFIKYINSVSTRKL